jgi:hypothetical protein
MVDTVYWLLIIQIIIVFFIWSLIDMRNTALFYREESRIWRRKFWEEEDKTYLLKHRLKELNDNHRKDDDS